MAWLGGVDRPTQDACRPSELIEAVVLQWVLYYEQWGTLGVGGWTYTQSYRTDGVPGEVPLYQSYFGKVPHQFLLWTTGEEYLYSSCRIVTLEGIVVNISIAEQHPAFSYTHDNAIATVPHIVDTT